MKNGIYDYYNNQIKDFEKLSFEDAKTILSSSMELDDKKKKETIERVFKGTLHYVLKYIESSKHFYLNSYNYDLNDVFNVCYTLWFEKIQDYSILMCKQASFALGNSFANEVSNRLIASNQELKFYKTLSYNDFFNHVAKIYFELRNTTPKTDVKELWNTLIEKISHNYPGFVAKFELEIILIIIEKCYMSFSENDTKDVILNNRTIIKLNSLMQEYGLYETINNNYPDNHDIESETINKIENQKIYDMVFNSDLLTDMEKGVIAQRFAFFTKKASNYSTIARYYGVKAYTIQMIEAKTLRKLKDVIDEDFKHNL